jgi:hypothetical protein
LFLRNNKRNNSFSLHKIILDRDGFKLLPDPIESGLIFIDGLAGAMKAFNATDGKRNRPESDPIFFVAQFAFLDGFGCASEQDAQELFFVPEFAANVIIQALNLGGSEGMGIKAVLEGIPVTERGTDLIAWFFGRDDITGLGG